MKNDVYLRGTCIDIFLMERSDFDTRSLKVKVNTITITKSCPQILLSIYIFFENISLYLLRIHKIYKSDIGKDFKELYVLKNIHIQIWIAYISCSWLITKYQSQIVLDFFRKKWVCCFNTLIWETCFDWSKIFLINWKAY